MRACCVRARVWVCACGEVVVHAVGNGQRCVESVAMAWDRVACGLSPISACGVMDVLVCDGFRVYDDLVVMVYVAVMGVMVCDSL